MIVLVPQHGREMVFTCTETMAKSLVVPSPVCLKL